ncbi:MAG TPA: sodium:proton exchanger [Gimesia maris]|uniref:Sodium:proton exchanger n=1 Tax=Gimesia maris TaxID=122 RepID=A0A3D3R6H5_9PLAN|nr:sodium:proton exchanger [Gimesia maris]|tara:strand:- start:70286 stop:71986 length:1701 start_codon:yes stop_codon:yes gene_type:complete
MEIGNIFYEFALLLAAAGVLGLVAHSLKQPLIIAFIAVGILVGPAGLKWVTIGSEIDLLSKVGIALLLFTVGLKLDLHVIRTMGPVSLATGLGQVIFTSVIGYVICLALGLSHLSSIYVAVALTFSSTIIIVKLLSDKREIDSLHGRIAVGFLIVQDLVVVLVMIVLTAFGAGQRSGEWATDIFMVAAQGAALMLVLGLMMRYIIPPVFQRASKSIELLTTLAIAWAIALAAIGDWLGFSKEVGAFLAGVSLAPLAQRDALGARLVGLRDFLLLFFFVDLGAHLTLSVLGPQLLPALILSLFVLIGNPLIVMVIMGAMGYRKRTGFLAGLTVAQISEFSLMLGALGKSLGHISGEILALITLIGLITITLSTYLITYSHVLYERLATGLSWFERKNPFREIMIETTEDSTRSFDVIVFGLGRFGNHITNELSERGRQVLGVDFDPDVVRRLRERDCAVVYGDAEDPVFAATLPLSRADWVVCSVPQQSVNLALLQSLERHGFAGHTATTAHNAHSAEELKKAGSDVVLLPFLDAAKEAVDRVCGFSRAEPNSGLCKPDGSGGEQLP